MAIADRVPCGLRVADIGADHARLCVWLAKNKCCKCIATDKNMKPLHSAKDRIETHGNRHGIDFRLGDGLECVSPDEVDAIVIAGMGGETIVGILKPWAKDKLCVLQPNTHPERLTEYLIANGYKITDDTTVSERGRKYCVITTTP